MKSLETRRPTGGLGKPLEVRSRRSIPTPSQYSAPVTRGSADASDWLQAQGLASENPHWFVEIGLDVASQPALQVWNGAVDTRFHLYVYPVEWGFFFCHAGRASWIRVAEHVRVHGRDDFALASQTPPLRDVSQFIHALEQQHQVALRRDLALIRTNVDDAEPALRRWLTTL